MRVTNEQRHDINAFARQHRTMAVYSHCESAYRVGTMPEGGTEEGLNLAYFGVRTGGVGATDLADFGPRLANLRHVEDHESGRTVVDFYVYGRDKVGGELQLDTNVQAVWQDGELIALVCGQDRQVVNTPHLAAYVEEVEVEERHEALRVIAERGTTLPPPDALPRLTPTVVPTPAWCEAHMQCDHFEGICKRGDVDYTPLHFPGCHLSESGSDQARRESDNVHQGYWRQHGYGWPTATPAPEPIGARLLVLSGQINELAGDDTYGLALQEIAEELRQLAARIQN